MLINKTNQTFLRDRHDNPIALGKLSFADELVNKGYNHLNAYNMDGVLLPFSVLSENFDPITNLEELSLREEGFFTHMPWWYHPEMDFYIRVGAPRIREGVPLESCKIYAVLYTNDRAKEVKDFLNNHLMEEINTGNTIEIVVKGMRGSMEFQSFPLQPTEICVETMYNDDFKPVYDHILDKLNETGKGVVLFHGLAGTGKTHLIKHLTTKVDKRFIFLPVEMIHQLTNPGFMPMLLSRPNSVLVLEDCENYIEDRNLGRSGSVVSSLLQITDGILSDVLNLQVICTFNTGLTRIDAALLREGRLIAEYEFKELEEKKWELLVNHEKLNGKRTLANAFNVLTLRSERVEKVAIGF